MEKPLLITGKALARVIAWQAGESRAAVQTKRRGPLVGDAIVGSALITS